jgi:hypothetical protein
MPRCRTVKRSRTPPRAAAYVARDRTEGGYGYWLTAVSIYRATCENNKKLTAEPAGYPAAESFRASLTVTPV